MLEGVFLLWHGTLPIDEPVLYQVAQSLFHPYACAEHRFQKATPDQPPDDGSDFENLLQVGPQTIDAAQNDTLDGLWDSDSFHFLPDVPGPANAKDNPRVNERTDQL